MINWMLQGGSATLSQLKRWGYPVPMGWVLPAGDDPEPLIKFLQNSDLAPLVVRSSAVGKTPEQASAAGQVQILNVYTREAAPSDRAVSGFLRQPRCFTIPATRASRRDGGADSKQVRGVFQELLSAAIQLTSMTMRL